MHKQHVNWYQGYYRYSYILAEVGDVSCARALRLDEERAPLTSVYPFI
jgi:hypothetical protein